MNYRAHYDRLIERARGRTLTGYRERHHVVPRCVGGGNEAGNLVELTGEEHYVAHQLLAKMHPAIIGLTLAAIRMAKQCTGNKAYGWLRRRYAEWRRARPVSDATRAKMAANRTGKKHSAATKAKIGAAHRRLGTRPVMTQAVRDYYSAQRRGCKREPFTAEHRARIGAKSKGRVFSDEARAKISASVRGRTMSPETRAKMSAAKAGVKRAPFKRGPHSAEHRAKISAAHRARHARLAVA